MLATLVVLMLVALVVVSFRASHFFVTTLADSIRQSMPVAPVASPATATPASQPAASVPMVASRPVPQFKAVERAKEGNTFDKRGCYAFYDSQGIDGDEFWNEGTGTCR
jgi:hypothetical protein